MKKRRIRTGSRLLNWCLALIFIAIGIALSLTIVGAIIGVPLILCAVFMHPSSKKVWRCPKCRVVIDRG